MPLNHRANRAANTSMGMMLLATAALLLLVASPTTAFLGSLRGFSQSRAPIGRAALASMTGSSEETLGICSSTPTDYVNSLESIPTEYNVHTAYPSCEPVVRNQGTCGSCWAFAATGVYAERLCVQSDQVSGSFQLAPQPLVSCTDEICYDTVSGNRCAQASGTCKCSLGCSGGYPDGAFRYMTDESVALEVCARYTSGDGSSGSTCQETENSISSCTASSNTTFSGRGCYYHSSSDLATVQRDIMQNGPVLATFLVYEDFYTYGSGVYTCPTGESAVGAHAVIVTGWGVESNVPYWLIENSWGSGWGDDGYVKIKRGSNECNIENSIVTTTVDAENIQLAQSVYSSATGVNSSAAAVSFLAIAAAALAFLRM